jgi:hypothetical protein
LVRPLCRGNAGLLSPARQYAAQGVQFVGIGIDDVEKMRTFVKAMPVAYPLLVADAADSQMPGLQVKGLPYTLVIGPDGRFAAAAWAGSTRPRWSLILRAPARDAGQLLHGAHLPGGQPARCLCPCPAATAGAGNASERAETLKASEKQAPSSAPCCLRKGKIASTMRTEPQA